jgi:hypothetical protein
LPACGQQDDTQRILAQCGNPAPNQIDSCIEQARVQQEADPSPEMKALIASLVRREADARNQPQSLQPSVPSDASDAGNTYDAPPTPPPEPGGSANADQSDDDTGQPPPQQQDNEQNPPPDSGGPGRANDV